MVASGRIGTVLVVDDDPATLSWFRRAIEASYTALTAPDGVTARSLARQRPPDLMIIDLCLGRESGIELIRVLKPEFPDAITVMISGWASLDHAVAAAHAGANHVMSKPVTFQEIINRVHANGTAPADVGVPVETPTLARAEWEHISRVINDCDGNLSLAARRLGVYRSTLQRRLRKYAPRS